MQQSKSGESGTGLWIHTNRQTSKFTIRHDFLKAVEETLKLVKSKEESYYWVCFLGTLVIISLYNAYKPNRWMAEINFSKLLH